VDDQTAELVDSTPLKFTLNYPPGFSWIHGKAVPNKEVAIELMSVIDVLCGLSGPVEATDTMTRWFDLSGLAGWYIQWQKQDADK
jgi:hypothetical protein